LTTGRLPGYKKFLSDNSQKFSLGDPAKTGWLKKNHN